MATPNPSVVDDPTMVLKQITNDENKEFGVDALGPYIDVSNAASKENQRAVTGEVVKPVLLADDASSLPEAPSTVSLSQGLSTEEVGDKAVDVQVADTVTTSTEQVSANESTHNELLASIDDAVPTEDPAPDPALLESVLAVTEHQTEQADHSFKKNGVQSSIPDTSSLEENTVPDSVQELPIVYEALSSDQTDAIQVKAPIDASESLSEQPIEEIHDHLVIEQQPEPVLQEVAQTPAESLSSEVETTPTVVPSEISESVQAVVPAEDSVLATTSTSDTGLVHKEITHAPAKELSDNQDSQVALSYESTEPASGTAIAAPTPDVVNPIDTHLETEPEVEEIVTSPQFPITTESSSIEVTPTLPAEDAVVPTAETSLPLQVEEFATNSAVETDETSVIAEKEQVDHSQELLVPVSAQQSLDSEVLDLEVPPAESQAADLKPEAVSAEVQEPVVVSVEASHVIPAKVLVYEGAIAPTETAIEHEVEHQGQVMPEEPHVVETPATNLVADADVQVTQDHVKEEIPTGDLPNAHELAIEEPQESREPAVMAQTKLVASEPEQTVIVLEEKSDSVEHHEPEIVTEEISLKAAEGDEVDLLVPADTVKSTNPATETEEAIPLATAEVSVEREEPQTTTVVSSIDIEVKSLNEDQVDVLDSHVVEQVETNLPAREEPVQESSSGVAQDKEVAVAYEAPAVVETEALIVEGDVSEVEEHVTSIGKDEPAVVEVPAVDIPSPEPTLEITPAKVEADLKISTTIESAVVDVTPSDADANSLASVEAIPIEDVVMNSTVAPVDESVSDDNPIFNPVEDEVREPALVDSISESETSKAEATNLTQLSPHEIERPKSPFPPSFQVTTVGRGISPTKDDSLQDELLEATTANTEPATETDPGAHQVITEVKSDTEANQLDVPKDESSLTPPGSWTPSYSVHSQGSPLLGPVDFPPPIDGGEGLADDTRLPDEHVLEETIFSQNDEIAVLSADAATEPNHTPSVETPSADTSERVSTPAPSDNQIPELKTPEVIEVIREVPVPSRSERPIDKVEHFVPEVSEASALVDLNAQEPQPQLNLDSSNLAAPVDPDIERPSSPSSWVPSYSVSTQGSQPSQEGPPEDAGREMVNVETAANIPTLDQLPVKDESQVNEPVVHNDVSSDVLGAHLVQQLIIVDPILDEPSNSFDRAVEETPVETTVLPDLTAGKSVETPVILPDDSHGAVAPIEGDRPNVPVLLFNNEATDANEKDLSSDENSREQPPRPWTPSYSVITQGPGTILDTEQNETLAPVDIAELTGDNSQVANEVNALDLDHPVIKNSVEEPNAVSNPQPSEASSSEPTESNLAHSSDAPLTSGQCTPTVPSGARTPTIGDSQESQEPIFKQLFPTTDTTADFISRLFVVTEDADRDPSSTASESQPPSTRQRLESAASSRFFPGAWFSHKAPHDGRTSLEIAQGEFSSSKPTSPISDSLPASAVDGSRSLTDEEKKRWCVIM